MKEHIDLIADLLLGAAFADKHFRGDEREAIALRLRALLDTPTLPDEVQGRLRAFNPARFDPTAAARRLAGLTDDEKRSMLEWIASIHDADEELDLDEDEYLRLVAQGFGFSEEDIADLTLEILEISDLTGALSDD